MARDWRQKRENGERDEKKRLRGRTDGVKGRGKEGMKLYLTWLTDSAHRFSAAGSVQRRLKTNLDFLKPFGLETWPLKHEHEHFLVASPDISGGILLLIWATISPEDAWNKVYRKRAHA